MKRFLLAVALYLTACHDIPMSGTYKLKPLPDSLNFLWRNVISDTLVDYKSGAFLRVYRWHNDLLGIYEDDTTCMVLRRNSRWWLIDTLNVPFCGYIDTMDLNGDGYKDILMSCPSAHGNYFSVPILSAADGTLKVCRQYKLPNFAYVPELHIVRAYWAGNWYSTYFKEEYVWQGDSLLLREGVRMLPPANMDDTSPIDTLEYYRMNGGKEFVYKRLISDSSREVYEHALWEGSEYSR